MNQLASAVEAIKKHNPAQAELKTQMLKDAFDASVFTMDPTPLREGPF